MAVLCPKYSGPTKHFTGELRRRLAHSGRSEAGGPCAFLSQAGLGLELGHCGSQPRPPRHPASPLSPAGAWAACSPVPHRVHSPQCLWAATQAVWGKASQETGAWRRSGSWALWGLTAGAGSWRVCVCVCVCVRARMLVGVLKSGVLVKESGLLGSV